MPILPSRYRAPLWLRNAHVNTIWSAKCRRLDFPDAAQAARCRTFFSIFNTSFHNLCF